MEIWLYRMLAIACAAMAGWALGRSNPGWNADVEGTNYGNRGAISGFSDNLQFHGGFCLAGTGGMLLWIIAAMFSCEQGWPSVTQVDEASAEHLDVLLLFSRPTWILIGSGVAAYIVARLTDKGPVGPLE